MNVVVTGASKGIGKAIALLFAEKGFDIAACSRKEENLLALKNELNDVSPTADIFLQQCDVSDKKQVVNFGKFALDTLRNVDILVNNAGVFLPGNIYEEEDGLLEKLIETNLYSAYHLSRVIIPEMIKRKKGHIFNICSVASIKAYDMGGSYAISKYALLGFSKNLREELKQFGIRVTAVLPGATLTDSWVSTTLPEQRFMQAADIAKLVYSAYEISERSVVEEIIVRPMMGDI
jgi:short-subunit dehydrogenase